MGDCGCIVWLAVWLRHKDGQRSSGGVRYTGIRYTDLLRRARRQELTRLVHPLPERDLKQRHPQRNGQAQSGSMVGLSETSRVRFGKVLLFLALAIFSRLPLKITALRVFLATVWWFCSNCSLSAKFYKSDKTSWSNGGKYHCNSIIFPIFIWRK